MRKKEAINILKSAPIGIFDSGLGGLTAVREIKKLMPHENVVYFGDTGRVPYGTRSVETIKLYARQAMSFLTSKGVKAVIAACGTVSSVAPELGESLPVAYTGVVKPSALSAFLTTETKRVGLIGTSATIRSGAFEREIRSLDPNITVFSKPCPLFVPLVENGYIQYDNKVTRMVCEDYLGEFRDKNIDTLILGCTHFPIIAPIISDIIGHGVTLIDTGREAAKAANLQLMREGLLSDSVGDGTYSYYVSDGTENFRELSELFLGELADENASVTLVHPEKLNQC